MRKLIMLMLIVVITSACSSNKSLFNSYSLDRKDLPEAAREMLDEYFPKAKVGMIKVDRHLLKKTDYDVRLVNGTTIEFSNSGKWKSVDCKSREVPQGLVVRPIRNYVTKNCNGAKIVRIAKKSSGYVIGLSDGIELNFNLLGQIKNVKLEE